MAFNIKGNVHLVGETKQVSDKFSKRQIVVETTDNPKYPQLVEFEATGDRCALLDGIGQGDSVDIAFNVRGREWKGPNGTKYFVSLDIWKVERIGAAASKPAGYDSTGGGPTDGLPF